jgi:hypothetical protein
MTMLAETLRPVIFVFKSAVLPHIDETVRGTHPTPDIFGHYHFPFEHKLVAGQDLNLRPSAAAPDES